MDEQTTQRIIDEINREKAQVKAAWVASWTGVVIVIVLSAAAGFLLGKLL